MRKDRRRACFTIALNGYEDVWRGCIDSQREYWRKHGYSSLLINEVPWAITPRQAAWLKVEIMRGLLARGFDVAFFDADCEIRGHTPPFESVFSDEGVICLAQGKSGRLNSGVVLLANSERSIEFIDLLLEKADIPVPKADKTAYENGHFIHYSRDFPGVQVLEHRLWNNNSVFDEESYIQHYSGGVMRDAYESEHGITLTMKKASEEHHQREKANSAREDLSPMEISQYVKVVREAFSDTLDRV